MNRLDYYFKQKVTEAELDKGFTYAESALKAVMAETGLSGVMYGLDVTQQIVPDMTVAVTGGGGYDHNGNPVRSAIALPPVSVAVDYNAIPTAVAGIGNEKIVAVFLQFDRALSDPRTDGNNLTVFFERAEFYKFKIMQSAEALLGTAVPVASDPDGGIRLCDVHLVFGQAVVLNADILINGREDAFTGESWGGTPAPTNIRQGTAVKAFRDLQTAVNAIIGGFTPVPATGVSYAGGGAWANGTTNPATTVEAQLDKMIGDLAAVAAPTGAIKIGTRTQTSGAYTVVGTTIEAQILEVLAFIATLGAASGVSAPAVAGSPSSLSLGTVATQLAALLGFVNARGVLVGGNVWTGGQTVSAGSVEVSPLTELLPAFVVGVDPAGERKLLFEFGETFGRVRFYLEGPTGANGYGAAGLTISLNAKWTTGTTWARDVATLAPVMITLTCATPFLAMKVYDAGAPASTFHQATNIVGQIQLTPGSNVTPHTTILDGQKGIIDSAGEITIKGYHRFVPGLAGAQKYTFTVPYPKNYPASPSSVTYTTVSNVNIASGPTLYDASKYSVATEITVTAAGVDTFIVYTALILL